MDVKLIVVSGNTKRREIPLRLPLTIGRGKEAGLTVAHPTVSRFHCKLYELEGAVVVCDNQSTNGTFIGQQQISGEAVLRPGDELTIGPLTFRAVYEHPGDNYPAVGMSDTTAPAAVEESAEEMDAADFFSSLDAPPADEADAPQFEDAGAGEVGEADDFVDTAQFSADDAAALDALLGKEEAPDFGSLDDVTAAEPPEFPATEEAAEAVVEEEIVEEVDELDFELNVGGESAPAVDAGPGADVETEEFATPAEESPLAGLDDSSAPDDDTEFDFLVDAPAPSAPAPPAAAAPPQPEVPAPVTEKPAAKPAKAEKPRKGGWWPFGKKPKAEKPGAKAPTTPVEPAAEADESTAAAPIEPAAPGIGGGEVPSFTPAEQPPEIDVPEFAALEDAPTEPETEPSADESGAAGPPASNEPAATEGDEDLDDFFRQMGLN